MWATRNWNELVTHVLVVPNVTSTVHRYIDQAASHTRPFLFQRQKSSIEERKVFLRSNTRLLTINTTFRPHTIKLIFLFKAFSLPPFNRKKGFIKSVWPSSNQNKNAWRRCRLIFRQKKDDCDWVYTSRSSPWAIVAFDILTGLRGHHYNVL